MLRLAHHTTAQLGEHRQHGRVSWAGARYPSGTGLFCPCPSWAKGGGVYQTGRRAL